MEHNARPSTQQGRHRIVSPYIKIDSGNVLDALKRAETAQFANFTRISYLHDYFLGGQPVLEREKQVREEINNPVVENRAYEFTKWKTSYLLGNPISYSARSGSGRSDDGEDNDTLSDAVQELNDACLDADKQVADLEMAQWAYECGVGYELILPDMGEKPFKVTSLDPRRTFVVYSNDPFHEPLFAASYSIKSSDTNEMERIWTVFTADRRFVTDGSTILEEEPNPLGMIPIIEYDANPERMGCFEPALTILDAINEVESNRVDGVAQFVQALMVFTNVDFDKSDLAEMIELGAVKIYSTDGNQAKVELLTAELDQQNTETLVNHLYKAALAICGMPQNMGGGASTSDTGVAVVMRDGWSAAESRAQETEMMFRRPERIFIKAAIKCISTYDTGFNLESRNVDIKFTRRNYENIQSKTQVLTTMLGSGKVHPRLAFEHCGMFSDPEAAYDASEAYVNGINSQQAVDGSDGEQTPLENRMSEQQ